MKRALALLLDPWLCILAVFALLVWLAWVTRESAPVAVPETHYLYARQR